MIRLTFWWPIMLSLPLVIAFGDQILVCQKKHVMNVFVKVDCLAHFWRRGEGQSRCLLGWWFLIGHQHRKFRLMSLWNKNGCCFILGLHRCLIEWHEWQPAPAVCVFFVCRLLFQNDLWEHKEPDNARHFNINRCWVLFGNPNICNRNPIQDIWGAWTSCCQLSSTFTPPQPATVAFKKWRTMFSSYVDTFFLPFLQILHSNSYHQGYYICLVGYQTQTFICYFFGTTPSTRWAPEPIVTYGVIRHRHM